MKTKEQLAEELFRTEELRAFAKSFLREVPISYGQVSLQNVLKGVSLESGKRYTLAIPEIKIDSRRGVLYYNRPSEELGNEVIDLGKSVRLYLLGSKRYNAIYRNEVIEGYGVKNKIVRILVDGEKFEAKDVDDLFVGSFNVAYFYDPERHIIIKADGINSPTKQIVIRKELNDKIYEAIKNSDVNKGPFIPEVTFSSERSISKMGNQYRRLTISNVSIIPQSQANLSDELIDDLIDVVDYLNYKYGSKMELPRIAKILGMEERVDRDKSEESEESQERFIIEEEDENFDFTV